MRGVAFAIATDTRNAIGIAYPAQATLNGGLVAIVLIVTILTAIRFFLRLWQRAHSAVIEDERQAFDLTAYARQGPIAGSRSAGHRAGDVGVDPALLVLATAAGSNTLTHINDASFWLFKGYFDLSVKDTLKTWGLLELVNSVVGLIIVLIISMIA